MMSITDAKCKEIEERGFKAVRIDVDVDELIAWCHVRGMQLTPESRTRFTLEKLKEMIKVLD
jgi:hypothetical protein